jgi:uncharacterized protein YbjQ (UPF0145 family)
MSEEQNQKSPYRVGAEANVDIVVTTTNEIDGYAITHYLGIVRGITVRSASIGQGIVGAFKSIGGGNIEEWAEVCEEARHESHSRMMAHARELGAHGIIGMRYDATEFMQGATEVLSYGTAVLLQARRRE